MKTALDGKRSQSIQELKAWANRVALPPELLDSFAESLRTAYEELVAREDEYSEESLPLNALSTNEEPVPNRLVVTLEGRVGAPMSPEELDEAKAEANGGSRTTSHQAMQIRTSRATPGSVKVLVP